MSCLLYTSSAYTFCVGEVDEEIRNLLKVTKEALYIGIQNAVQGKRIGDIGYAIQPVSYTHLDVYKRQVSTWCLRALSQMQRIRKVVS